MSWFYDPKFISGIVGTGIHGYSVAINNDHFNEIFENFANGQYVVGALKTAVPFSLPITVSLFSRRGTRKEAQGRIESLEQEIRELRR